MNWCTYNYMLLMMTVTIGQYVEYIWHIVNFVSEKNITLGKLFFPYQLFVSKALN